MIEFELYYDGSDILIQDLGSYGYTPQQRDIIEQQVKDDVLSKFGQSIFEQNEGSRIGSVLIPSSNELGLGMTDFVVKLN